VHRRRTKAHKAVSAVLPTIARKAVLFLLRPYLQEEIEVQINLEPHYTRVITIYIDRPMATLALFLCFSFYIEELAAVLNIVYYSI
jgi:hypothetical protein